MTIIPNTAGIVIQNIYSATPSNNSTKAVLDERIFFFFCGSCLVVSECEVFILDVDDDILFRLIFLGSSIIRCLPFHSLPSEVQLVWYASALGLQVGDFAIVASDGDELVSRALLSVLLVPDGRSNRACPWTSLSTSFLSLSLP